MKKALVFFGLVTLAVAMMATAAGANTGEVAVAQDCQTWSASVTLHSDVSLSHWVEVITTIPGTQGVALEHAQGPQVLWSAKGTAPQSGSVTLNILYANKTVEHSYTKSLPSSADCETTTTAATTTTVAPTTTIPETTTSVVDTTTTMPPLDTTTIFATTSTTVPPTTTTVPPPGATTTTTTPPGSCTPGVPPCAPTGSHSGPLVGGALVALAAGSAFIYGDRKRKYAR